MFAQAFGLLGAKWLRKASPERSVWKIIGKPLSEEGVGKKVNIGKQKYSANVDSSALCWKGADA